MGMTKIAFTTWTQPSDILGSCHSCCKVQSRVYLRFGQTLPLLASNLNPEETTADNIPLMQAGVQRCSLVQKNSSTGEKSRFVLAKTIQLLVFLVSSSAPNQQVLPLPKHLAAFWFPDTQLPRLSHAFAGQILGWTAAVTFPKTWGFLEKPLQWQGNNCSSMLATLRIKNIGKKNYAWHVPAEKSWRHLISGSACVKPARACGHSSFCMVVTASWRGRVAKPQGHLLCPESWEKAKNMKRRLKYCKIICMVQTKVFCLFDCLSQTSLTHCAFKH